MLFLGKKLYNEISVHKLKIIYIKLINKNNCMAYVGSV